MPAQAGSVLATGPEAQYQFDFTQGRFQVFRNLTGGQALAGKFLDLFMKLIMAGLTAGKG